LKNVNSFDVLSPIKLCIVEDNELLLEIVVDSLIQVGYDVQGFDNGVSAWHALQTQSFDLVLSDVEMPYLGGIELLVLIQTLDKPVPVILFSGNFTLKAAIENGAQGFVPKPFLRDDLVNEINLALNKPGQAASGVKRAQQ
jgi:DNA-binding NtrC family response regulator